MMDMVAENDLGFPPGFVPPKNLQYFLLILKDMKKVRGRTKLFKIHSLIEEEGRVKYNLPINTFQFGPVDYETFNFCNTERLIEEIKVPDVPYDYYEISLTGRGKLFFEKFCKPNMEQKEVKKALEIIEKYKAEPGSKILTHIHAKYVDPYKKKVMVKAVVEDSISRINMIMNIVRNASAPSEDSRAVLMGELRHIAELLKSLNNTSDPTKIGTILATLNQFFEYLKLNNYIRNAFTIELFEFLDHYADKEGIQKSITSDDFSDIPPEDREKLFHAIADMEIPARKS